jgi:mannose-6-phosphate isomerase-like protein (cupin superfamily)
MVENFAETIEKATGLKTNISCSIMDNKELRFRVVANNGVDPFAYNLVATPDKGGWQNAHNHQHIVETWVVSRGCQIVMEEQKNLSINITILEPGDTYSSTLGLKHNCYVFPNTITHTIKTTIGNYSLDGDWDYDEEFDKFTKSFDMDEFIKENNLEKYL